MPPSTAAKKKKAGPPPALPAPGTPAKDGRGRVFAAPMPTPGFDRAQVSRAAAALAKHARAAAGAGLFADDDELVYLVRCVACVCFVWGRVDPRREHAEPAHAYEMPGVDGPSPYAAALVFFPFPRIGLGRISLADGRVADSPLHTTNTDRLPEKDARRQPQ